MMNLERTLSSKGSLANRFALWVAFMTLLVIAGLGVYFDHFLRTSFLESAKTRIAYGYERLSYNLDQIETGLKDGVAFLRVDKTVLASINLINLYEDRKRYNSFLIDEEKKALAEELLNKVKFSFNDSIVLYGKNMDVIAYVAKGEVGYHLNIVSYKNGRLTLLRRYEHEVEYREVPHSSMQDDGVQHEHINYYTNEALLSGTVITRHHAASGLVLRSHLRLLAEEGAPVAHIEMSRVLGGDYFLALSGNMNLNISLSTSPPDSSVEMSTLDQVPAEVNVQEVAELYSSSASLDTRDGVVYFSVNMERDLLVRALGQNRTLLMVWLLLTVLFALFWIRYITVRRLRRPLESLMAQIGKIQRQDYSPTEVVASGDELQQVSESINLLADTVMAREQALKASQKELVYLSDHDVLTGLPNRRYWSRFLSQALNRATDKNQQLAVLFIDLDQFKQVNDIQGHDIGDKLLQVVAARLESCLMPDETLARIGGDEFNFLLEKLNSAEDAEFAARRIIQLFKQPFRVGKQLISISASIGITLFPRDASDSITLTKYADLAMYKAKETGRNNYCFFTEELSSEMKGKAELTSALRNAIQDMSEFELYYQPKVSSYTGKIVSAEALVRWNHPDMGLVSPARFIPLAEELGLIVPLGEWVLEIGCRDFMRLESQGISLNHVSINVSGIQLDHEGFSGSVDRVIRETGIPAHALELEITESYIARQPEEARLKLKSFRDRGVRLAIDDFGTGYSAMNTLKNLPVTRLKIDKSFVDGLPHDGNSVALVRAIVTLAKNFELELTAEGVESIDQLAFLTAEQCEEIQGYYFSRPLTFEGLIDFCTEGQKLNRPVSPVET